VKIGGPGDFERTFGGVSAGSGASYAINEFFNNDGSQTEPRPKTTAASLVDYGDDPGATDGLRGRDHGSIGGFQRRRHPPHYAPLFGSYYLKRSYE
jgi:hypothetical protein